MAFGTRDIDMNIRKRCIFSICFALLLLVTFLIAGCATTTHISPASFGTSSPLQAKAAVHWQNIHTTSQDQGTPSNYRVWIQEILNQTFQQVTVVSKLEDVAQSDSDVVVTVDFAQSFSSATIGIDHMAQLSVYGINDEKLFSRESSTTSFNWAGKVNDHRNAAIKTFSPIVRHLVADDRVANYLSSPRPRIYAERFRPPQRLIVAAKASSITPPKRTRPSPPKPTATPAPSQASFLSTVTADHRGQHWAVIIGVSDYKDSRVPSLRYAEEDAKAFYRWITSPNGGRYAPANVRFLIGEDATVKNIRMALFQWLKQAIQEDTVTIFFAGHGSPESPDSTENLYLLPYDVEHDNIPSTAFPMWDIETALKRHIKAKRVIVVADACHSGGVGQSFDTARRAGRGLKVVPVNSGLRTLSTVSEGICVISASDDKQLSQEGEQWGGRPRCFHLFLPQGFGG